MENGKFKNGIPIDEVPPHLRRWFYLLDHLDGILQNPVIYQVASIRFKPEMIGRNLVYKPDIFGPIEGCIKAAILAGEKSIRKVYIVRWLVDKEDSLLTCVVLCLLVTGEKGLFALKFQQGGGTRLVVWHSRKEQKEE